MSRILALSEETAEGLPAAAMEYALFVRQLRAAGHTEEEIRELRNMILTAPAAAPAPAAPPA